MKQPKYLLLGWKPKPSSERQKFTGREDQGKIPGALIPLATGNAKSVIAAACAADCGVLLFDTTQK